MHGHPAKTLGAWAAGHGLLPPHPASSASLSHRRTELRIYARELRGWQGCDGPVCVCNGVRVGGCEGGWAERLPWHSALGVGLPHTEGEEVGGREEASGRGPRLGGFRQGRPVCTGRQGAPSGAGHGCRCRSPSGPLAPPSGSHRALAPGKPWESCLSGRALSASDSSQTDPSYPCVAPPRPGDEGGLREGLPQWHCPLLIEFPVPCHLFHDQVRSPLGPLSPVALWASFCQIP